MKKLYIYLIACVAMLGFTKCDSLDMEPQSSITDANYWKSDAQFSAFNVGLHAKLRETSYNIFLLGEPRSDIYSGESSYYGGAPQGNEHLPFNTLNVANTGISNFAGMYTVINQLNLMIEKTTETGVLSADAKNYYLGEAYGMRAYLYFHLLRSWGDVIIWTSYTNGASLDLSDLTKGASPAAEVMAQIKSDIEASENAFGNQTRFKYDRHFWSKAATLMLKGEVYLWSGNQMGGGSADFAVAKTALQSLVNYDQELTLNSDFSETFAYNKKNNSEIIFAIRNQLDEFDLWNNNYRLNMVPLKANQLIYFDENFISFKDMPEESYDGLIRFAMKNELYTKVYHDKDSRKRVTMKAVYEQDPDTKEFKYIGVYAHKFRGTLKAGSTVYTNADDYPIYRYADCLLLLAEAKAFLNEDPSAEINAVRERAYGKEYFNANRATLAYPNDNDPEFYANNKFVDPDSKGALEAVLKERLREFIIEGKRWYDLRLAGDKYVLEHTSAVATKLLWPIDANTLTNNKALEQTPGYENKSDEKK